MILSTVCLLYFRLGESCSHIGALLFKIEAAVRAGFTARACKDEACQWNNDFVSEIQGAPLAEIKFYDEIRVKKNKEKRGGSLSETVEEKGLPEDKKKALLQKLSGLDKKPITLHCFSEHYESFKPKFVPAPRGRIPASLRTLYSENVFSQDDLKKKCSEVFQTMEISKADAKFVYQSTKKRSPNHWHGKRLELGD